jgi:hypothetical protein
MKLHLIAALTAGMVIPVCAMEKKGAAPAPAAGAPAAAPSAAAAADGSYVETITGAMRSAGSYLNENKVQIGLGVAAGVAALLIIKKMSQTPVEATAAMPGEEKRDGRNPILDVPARPAKPGSKPAPAPTKGKQADQPYWVGRVYGLLEDAYPELKTQEARKPKFAPRLAQAMQNDPHNLLADEEFMGRLSEAHKAIFVIDALNVYVVQRVVEMLLVFADMLKVNSKQKDIEQAVRAVLVPAKLAEAVPLLQSLETKYKGRFSQDQVELLAAYNQQYDAWAKLHVDFIGKHKLAPVIAQLSK